MFYRSLMVRRSQKNEAAMSLFITMVTLWFGEAFVEYVRTKCNLAFLIVIFVAVFMFSFPVKLYSLPQSRKANFYLG